MLEIKVTETKTIKLPTYFKEITADWLLGVSQRLKLSDDYSLIALVSKSSLFTLATVIKQNKKSPVSAVPIYVKSGYTDTKFIRNIKTGERLVASSTELDLGFYTDFPDNTLSISKFTELIKEHSNIADIQQNPDTAKTECYFVEFKIVPNSVLHACHSDLNGLKAYDNPFTTTSDNCNPKSCGDAAMNDSAEATKDTNN